MRLEYLKLAIESITARPLRTFLTLLGIVIGVGAVISLISLGDGLQNAVAGEFESLGTDKILVSPQGNRLANFGSGSGSLSTDDVDVIKNVGGVLKAGYFVTRFARINWGDESGIYPVIGVGIGDSYDLLAQIQPLDVAEGRDLRDADRNSVILGYDYANFEGFEDKLRLRSNIDILGTSYRVVGINKEIGNDLDDRSIYMSIAGFNDLFDVGDSADEILVQTRAGEDPAVIAVEIEDALRRSRNVGEGEEDFSVETFENLISSFLSIFTVITTVIVGISSISLVVGSLGIMNTMFTSVLERTREIGVLKAIGARSSDIRQIFVFEAAILGLLGGFFGILVGYALAYSVEFYVVNILEQSLLSISFSWVLSISALIFSLILGIISGLLPAFRASRLSPVEALRDE